MPPTPAAPMLWPLVIVADVLRFDQVGQSFILKYNGCTSGSIPGAPTSSLEALCWAILQGREGQKALAHIGLAHLIAAHRQQLMATSEWPFEECACEDATKCDKCHGYKVIPKG